MAEDMIEQVRKITKDTRFVRNICTSAHIHHGKCITGDSRVLLSDGRILTARELYDYCEKNGILFENKKEEHVIYDTSKLDFNVFSLNKDTNKIEKKAVSMAWRLNGGNIIRLKLRNGAEISTTPEHKYLVYKNSEINDIEAKDIALGDRVVCPSNIEVESTINIKEDILKLIAEKNFYVNLKTDFFKSFKYKILKYGVKDICAKINCNSKPKSFYHGLWQNRILLSHLLKIAGLFGISLEEIYNNISLIYYRTGKQRGQNSNPIRMPSNFLDFFYLAGLFTGDGSNKKFVVGKEKLGNRFLGICGDLGFSCSIKQYNDKTPEIITNRTLVELLNSLFDYPLRKKSHNVRISEFLMRSSNIYLASFLSGYFDTDGTVENSRRAISISSASGKMLDDLQLVLLRFGCVGIKNDNTLYLSGVSAKNFADKIGFELKEKQRKAITIADNILGSRVCDNIGLNIVSNGRTLQAERIKQKNFELSFIEVSGLEISNENVVYDFTVNDNHNFVANGMFIHNTAFTDNLLAAAGMMSEKNAGDLDKGMATWQHADEQERLLTVDSANVSMIHSFQGNDYLINLIDTPGHVDFGGNVTRAMRAIDGTVVLVCASEGIMPQTENVLKQALRERVKPILFINKVDRLIKEMCYTPEQMQARFVEIITEFNMLVERMAEPEYKQKWKVSIQEGSVAFGSARDNWAMSLSFMQKKGVNFKDIINIYNLPQEERDKWVWDNAPLHEVILDMVIKHLPTPSEAQIYRIPKIWHGDLETQMGHDLMSCNPNGKIAFCITRVLVDLKSQREIAAGRLFSGTIRNGMEVYLNNAKRYAKVQQVLVYQGIKPVQTDEIVAGNVLGLMGVEGAAGETLTEEPEQAFEELKHIFEPVITKAISPLKAQDLPKVIEVLKTVSKEDPSIHIKINEETGESLMSGMGELHLEIVENRIKTEKHVEIKTSDPIVVYREAVMKKSPEVEGKSPNKHNKFYITVEPMPEKLAEAIKNGEIPGGRFRKKDEMIFQKIIECGVDSKEARKYQACYKGNILVDATRGVVHIGEVMELILDGFDQVMEAGPLAREPGINILVLIHDCKLHEDSIHRGPAQVLPAIRDAIREAMALGGAVMFEPVQVLQIDAPMECMGEISKLVANKRGQLLEMNQEEGSVSVKAKLPVAEMIGLTSLLRSATGGRGNFYIVDQMFEKVPAELQGKVIQSIRTRKGLSANA